MKKKPFICSLSIAALCLLSPLLHADDSRAPFLIVSDIDDTIKITDVLSAGKAIENGLFGKSTFTGMSELYRELTLNAQAAATPPNSLNPQIVYMSGSPPFLMKSIRKMLVVKHKFPDGKFMLRNWLKTKDIYEFKTAGFKLLASQSLLPFLALGDDTEKDPEVLSEFKAAHPPEKTIATYIHKVTGRALPPGLTTFYTAFDVALDEMEAGRLSSEQVIRVGNAILASNDPRKLFPSFTLCPEDLTYPVTPRMSQSPELVALSKRMTDYIVRYCYKRNGDEYLEAPKETVVTPSEMNKTPCSGSQNVTAAVVVELSGQVSKIRRQLLRSAQSDL